MDEIFALNIEQYRQLRTATVTPDQEAPLLLLMLIGSALGTKADKNAMPYLDLVAKYPDPTKVPAADQAAMSADTALALKALIVVFRSTAGNGYYTNLNSALTGAGAQTVRNSFLQLNAALSQAAIQITGLANPWDLDPPHPGGGGLDIVSRAAFK